MSKTQKFIIGFFIFIIVVLTLLFIRDYACPNNWSKPIDSLIFAHWGSSISGLMALGAFIFAFETFLNQKKSNEKREFENRFFRLVENLQFIVSQISITEPKRIEGRVALHILLSNLLEALPETTIDDLWNEGLTGEGKKRLRYDEFYNQYFYLLGHYFRFFYRILVFIDENEAIDKKEKQSYVDLLQAQISTDEMGLIFYNAFLNDKAKKKETGVKKFHDLLETYKVLENIDKKSVVKETDLTEYYPKTFKPII